MYLLLYLYHICTCVCICIYICICICTRILFTIRDKSSGQCARSPAPACLSPFQVWKLQNGAETSQMGLKSPAWVSKETLENAFDLPAYKGSLISNSVMMLTQKVPFPPVPNNLIALAPFKCLLAWSCHRRQTINWCHIKSWHVIKFWEMDNWVPKKVNQLVFPKHNQPISKPAKVFSQWQWAVSAGAEFFPGCKMHFQPFAHLHFTQGCIPSSPRHPLIE